MSLTRNDCHLCAGLNDPATCATCGLSSRSPLAACAAGEGQQRAGVRFTGPPPIPFRAPVEGVTARAKC